MAWPTTSRQSRGYGRAHERMREHLRKTVILCEECTRQGRITAGRIADHIVAKAKGGSDERSNYQLLCDDCSEAKTKRESAQARGIKYTPKQRIALDGWPEEE